MYNDSKVTAETESSAFQESSPNGLVAPLTKRPIEATTSSKLQKRKKRENEEDLLIKKALQCMEKAGREKKSVDGDDAFGNHIAPELCSIHSPYWKDWAKLQIQTNYFPGKISF